jgi:rubrerythrin
MSDLDNLLAEALNSELEAKKFYENAAGKAQSQAGKKLFTELAEFEQNHYDRVSSIIQSRRNNEAIKKTGHIQDLIKINAEIDGEIESNKDEIAVVFDKAIKAEKKAQERYRNIAKMFDDEEGKQIFMTLSNEEFNHQRILEDEFYVLSNKGLIIWE